MDLGGAAKAGFIGGVGGCAVGAVILSAGGSAIAAGTTTMMATRAVVASSSALITDTLNYMDGQDLEPFDAGERFGHVGGSMFGGAMTNVTTSAGLDVVKELYPHLKFVADVTGKLITKEASSIIQPVVEVVVDPILREMQRAFNALSQIEVESYWESYNEYEMDRR